MAKKRPQKKQQRPQAAKPKKKVIKIQEQLSRTAKIIIAVVFALLAIGIYAPSHNYEFVYDDDAVVKDNRYVKAGTDGLGKIWSTSYFRGMNERMNVKAFRPIPLTTLALELEFFDKKPATANEQLNWSPNPSIYHRFNILYYGITAFFLFLFLARLLREYHYLLPIMITLFFVVNPIHLEVVANIKSRDTILGFLGFASAAWLMLRALDLKQHYWLIPSALCFLFGLFSKEEVVTFVAIVPAMLWCFRRENFTKIALYSLPFLAMAGIYLLMRENILTAMGKGIEMKVIDNSLIKADELGLLQSSRLLAWWHYFRMTFFPHPLISDYSFSTLPAVGFGDWRVWAGLLAYAGMGAGMVYGLLKKKLYGFGFFYYLATFSVFSSFFFWNFSVYNDRFLYSPMLGIMVVISWAIYQLVQPKREDGKFETNFFTFASKNSIPLAIIAVLAIASIIKIETHLPVWESRYTLFEHDKNLTPNNVRMLKNYGGSLARQAMENADNPAERKRFAEEGIVILERAMGLYDRLATGWVHLGNCYFFTRDYDNAERCYRKALTIDNMREATINLANILCRTGRATEGAELLDRYPKTYFTNADMQVVNYCYEQAGR